jgi:hypothetical protein
MMSRLHKSLDVMIVKTVNDLVDKREREGWISQFRYSMTDEGIFKIRVKELALWRV